MAGFIGFYHRFLTKESIFLTVAVIGTYLFIRLLPLLDVLIAGGLTVFGVLMMVVIDKSNSARMPIFMALVGSAFLYTVFQLFTRWQENMKKSKAESALWDIVCGLGFEKISWEILAYIGWWVLSLLILRVMPHFGITVPMPFSFLMFLTYLGLVFWFCWLWLKNVAPALTGSLAICSIIFTLLFTTFFTVGASQPDFWSRVHGLFNALYMGAFGGLNTGGNNTTSIAATSLGIIIYVNYRPMNYSHFYFPSSRWFITASSNIKICLFSWPIGM